jgi:hypothetical protein
VEDGHQFSVRRLSHPDASANGLLTVQPRPLTRTLCHALILHSSTAPLAQAQIVSEPIVGRTPAKTDAGDDHPILAVDSRHLGDHIEYAAPRGTMSDD